MLTENRIKKLKVTTKRKTYKDKDSLFLRVYPSGVMSWILRYCAGGKVRDITLGHYPNLTLIQARQSAHIKREELKIKPSVGLTLKDAWQLWKRKKKGRIASYAAEARRFEAHILSRLGKVELDKISAPLALNAVLNLDKEHKLPTLKRMLMRLNEVLDLALAAGLINSNPCRRLSRLFASHVPRHRAYLMPEELGKLFELLAGSERWFVLYVKFCVWSMLRPIEVASLRWQ